ncbi:MAG: EAL domain-containing protein [Gammaproteobacteria bacterium]|nr:EAL domain-containing protein [Gammaproteobacteria bacterium]
MSSITTKHPADTMILIVDDDNVTRMTLQKVLEKSGYQVNSVDSGEKAIQTCVDRLPDLVLLDVMMPGLDGYETCAALRNFANYNVLPILILTGLDDMDSIDKAFQSGGTDFITKPFNWPLLTQRVRYALRTKELFNELNTSQKKLTKAQNIARIGYWEYNPATDIVTLSKETLILLGLFKEEYTLDSFLDNVSTIEGLQIKSSIKKAIATATSYQLEHSFTSGPGLELTISHYAEPSQQYNETILIGTFQDITERVEAENKIYFHRYFDEDTSLPNKEHLLLQLTKVIDNDSNDSLTAVAYLSFDKLRSIGTTLGNDFVNTFLITSSRLILDNIPEIKDIARIGNSSIGFLIKNTHSKDQIESICSALIELFRSPVRIDETDYHTTVNIGITIHPFDDDTYHLFDNAATAHKRCVTMDGSQYLFFNQEMDTQANELIELEKKMRLALTNNEFCAFFQPQIDTASNRLTGMEALARWTESDGNIIYPDQFIPLAEDTEMIIELGKEILLQACQFSKYLQDQQLGNVRVGVNLSAMQFADKKLLDDIKNILNDTGLEPALLEIEITESTAMTDIKHAVDTLNKIRKMGIKTSMDDFGTGYSSLSYLQKLPLDTLKIDQSFIRPIGANGEGSEIAKTIIAMGHSLNMHLIAEGAEEKYHYQLLKDQGCHEVQGYYFSKPVSAKDFEYFVREELESKF